MDLASQLRARGRGRWCHPNGWSPTAWPTATAAGAMPHAAAWEQAARYGLLSSLVRLGRLPLEKWALRWLMMTSGLSHIAALTGQPEGCDAYVTGALCESRWRSQPCSLSQHLRRERADNARSPRIRQGPLDWPVRRISEAPNRVASRSAAIQARPRAQPNFPLRTKLGLPCRRPWMPEVSGAHCGSDPPRTVHGSPAILSPQRR